MIGGSRGILLGCLGGTVGFFASSLVHYNLGDQEVAMLFFMLMGFGLKLMQLEKTPAKICIKRLVFYAI